MADVHDYTRRYWGHDYTFDPIEKGLRGRIMGWGYGLRDGDYLLLQNGDDSSRYLIERVRYLDMGSGDNDMWKADVVFAPRTAQEADRG